MHASVLGSAIALRLFLFFIPSTLTMIGLINFLQLDEIFSTLLDAADTETSVTNDLLDAANTSGSTGLGMVITGLFLVLWTGRSLAVVLVACSHDAWRVPGPPTRPKPRMLIALIGLLFAIVTGTTLMGRVRAIGGIALTSASIVATLALYTTAWFAISLILPRSTKDPGAMLPGAVMVGAGLTMLQLTTQLWLPQRFDNATEMMGSLAISVVSLGYLFFVGRLTSLSFVVNAVVFERVGSVSELMFSFPLVRRIPARWPAVAAFFDLQTPAITSLDRGPRS